VLGKEQTDKGGCTPDSSRSTATIADEEVCGPEVTKIVEKKGFWYTDGPIYNIARVKNTGNTDFDVTFRATLTSYFGGKEVATSIEGDAHTVLPDSAYKSIDKIGCSPGDREATIAEGGQATCVKAPWIGLYWLTESVTFMGETQTVKHLVLILPTWIIIVTIAVLIIIIYLIVWRHVTRRKKTVKTKSATLHNLKMKG
jgi:hypothetical protein